MKYLLSRSVAAPTRVRLCSTFLISLALLAIDNSSADITPVWLASDEGMAIVECEDTHRVLDGSSWSFQESPEGFLGQGALKHRGGAFETTSLLYHLHLEKNETCAFTLRASTSAPAETVMARLTDEDHRTLEFRSTGTEGWTLLSASPGNPSWTWLAGNHEIRITAAGEDLAIDRLYLHPASQPVTHAAAPSSQLLYSQSFDDLNAPTAPRNLRLKGHGAAHLHLQWDPSADEESGVLAYDIFWRRRWMGRSFRPEYVMDRLQPFALYHVNVEAVDLAGNASRKTQLLVETDPFDPAKGTLAQFLPAPPAIDGIMEPLWERLRAYRLTLPNGNTGPATFRLAWDHRHLYLLLLMQAAPSESPERVRLLLDPSLTQSARLGATHLDLFFPSVSDQDKLLHATGPSEKEGLTVHEIALPWSTLGENPAAGLLIGMNVSLISEDNQPSSAWRWEPGGQQLATDPYRFGVVQLCHGIPSGNEREWMPPNVWRERDGYVVVEAEAIEHDPAWQIAQKPDGFAGEGYLVWTRPPHYPVPIASPDTVDATTEFQGSQHRWLIVRVYTEKPGAYRCDVRFHASPESPRAWLWRVAHPARQEDPIRLVSLQGRSTAESGDPDQETFAWSTQGPHTFQLRRGINNFYISACTPRCAIDRIVLYREHDDDAKRKALDPATFASQAFR